jgi:hypothetical protein
MNRTKIEWVKNHDGSQPSRTPTKERLEELYWGANFSFQMVADTFGYTKTGIRDMFKRFGIPRRTLSEAQVIGGLAGRTRYRGGHTVLNGYRLVKKKGHPRANGRGYVMEHILVVEKELDRPLNRDEAVHHLNGIKHDNRPENLAVMPRRRHSPKLVENALKLRIRELEGRLLNYESHTN